MKVFRPVMTIYMIYYIFILNIKSTIFCSLLALRDKQNNVSTRKKMLELWKGCVRRLAWLVTSINQLINQSINQLFIKTIYCRKNFFSHCYRCACQFLVHKPLTKFANLATREQNMQKLIIKYWAFVTILFVPEKWKILCLLPKRKKD